MSFRPRISVALCTYNGERYLAEQLDSILDQRDVDLDVIAIDDASTDGTWNLLQARSRSDARLQVHRNANNLGVVANFERALRLCRGDFIALSDQDDVWHPDKLRILVDAIGDRDLAYCDADLIDAQGRSLGLRTSGTRRMVQGREPLAFAFHNCVSGHAILLRRPLLESALPMPSVRFHDWWLAFVAASRGGIVYVDRPLVRFRQHPGSQTDIAGARERAATREEHTRTFLARVAWIEALASLPGRDQALLTELAAELKRLEHAWFSPRLVRLLWGRRRELASIRGDRTAGLGLEVLRRASGLPLRHLLA